MKDKKTDQPFMNVWFGNFYRPAFDDKEFVRDSVRMLKELGFNSVMLDSKAWEDLRERFKGGAASEYVEQQEYMMEQCVENGISYNFLALYLNGDNLYPNIRFSPPIYGESVTAPDGSDGRWYKYWSDRAKDSMTEHISGLMRLYGKNVTVAETGGREVLPTCTMWDPIAAPSFDEEGRNRYISWLIGKYGSIGSFNAVYNTMFAGFDELKKEDYWYSCAYPGSAVYTKRELEENSPAAVMWIDNMKWRIDELCGYFKDMQQRIHGIDERIYTVPDMAQWSYFLNVDASQLTNVGFADLWDTSNRGIDIYKLAEHVDCCNFITVPITPYGDPDAYVTSCQHSMMRAMNMGREFIGGIYWGRFLYNDIYAFLTPCEIMGTIAASGAKGCTAYGMCGLDDGGVLHRMDKGFKESLKTANEWAKQAMDIAEGMPRTETAILFPSAMSAYEPMGVEGNKERRYDLLGWYRMCCDLGCAADVIDPGIIERGGLDKYRLLIVPENDCYRFDDNSIMEARITEWVKNGGTLIHGPYDGIAENCFGICGEKHEADAFDHGEGGLAQSDIFCSYRGKCLAAYRSDGAAAVAENHIEDGMVYSFGFAYGFSYSAKIAPHVPLSQRNNELYPVPLMKRNIFEDIVDRHGIYRCEIRGKGIETAEFENCIIVVNHTSHMYELSSQGEKLFQYKINDSLLMPRTAVLIFK